MRKVLITFLFLFLFLCHNAPAQIINELPKVEYIDYQPGKRFWFARYGQFQINFDYTTDETNGLVLVKNQKEQVQKIEKCLEIALEKGVNVLVFPELTIALSPDKRNRVISLFEEFAKKNDSIIIAGTYYDDKRYARNLTVLPTGLYYTYKIRPSIFEVSPLSGEGMKSANTLHVFKTKYGNFLTLVCVDLISDDANYTARSLSNRGLIDILININYNPKSQEFMREASAMTTRHPLFVSLTNVSLFNKGCTIDGNEFGNSSIFGSINKTFQRKILENVPDCYKTEDKKQLQPAYKSLLGLVNPEIEGLLIYDINLRVIRTPAENNAPDQGYPTIKNIEVVPIT